MMAGSGISTNDLFIHIPGFWAGMDRFGGGWLSITENPCHHPTWLGFCLTVWWFQDSHISYTVSVSKTIVTRKRKQKLSILLNCRDKTLCSMDQRSHKPA
jgi:hypothetical protein